MLYSFMLFFLLWNVLCLPVITASVKEICVFSDLQKSLVVEVVHGCTDAVEPGNLLKLVSPVLPNTRLSKSFENSYQKRQNPSKPV